MICTECKTQADTMSCPPCKHKNCQCESKSDKPKQCAFASTSGSCRLCDTCSEVMKRCQKCTREILVEEDTFTDEVLGNPLSDSDLA